MQKRTEQKLTWPHPAHSVLQHNFIGFSFHEGSLKFPELLN